MLCAKPFRKGILEFGCQQCLPCRINKRRLWTGRMVMESLCHAKSWFVTITYNDENIPNNGTLVPDDLKGFIKRLRFHSGQTGLRYFAVGEYGDRSLRPHYHLVLFGLDDPVMQPIKGALQWRSESIQKSWDKGFYTIRPFEQNSAEYTAGYCVKKLTKEDDSRLPKGCIPEFTRMSLRPGLGYYFAKEVSKSQNTLAGVAFIQKHGDVFPEWRVEGRKWPFGRYLKSIIREESGYGRETPPHILQNLRLQKLAEYATPEQLEAREAKRKRSAVKAIRKAHTQSLRRKI